MSKLKKILVVVIICLAVGICWLMNPNSSRRSGKAISQQTEQTSSSRNSKPFVASPDSPDGNAVHSAIPKPTKQQSDDILTVRAAIERLRLALNRDSEEEFDAALQFLSQLLQNHPRTIADVLTTLASETEVRVLAGLSRILAPHTAANAELLEKVLGLAQNSNSPAIRSEAVSMLFAVYAPTPEVLDAVLRVSREDPSKEPRLSAIQVLGRWSRDPERWDELSRELVKTIDISTEHEVRGYAIQVIALSENAIPPDVLGAMADYLINDQSAHNRALAALGLGNAKGEFREAALKHLERAFAFEENLTTRRNMLTQIARSGEQDAIAILQRLPADDPLLQMDVNDYLEILQSGGLNSDDIYFEKFKRDAERGTIVGSYEHHD